MFFATGTTKNLAGASGVSSNGSSLFFSNNTVYDVNNTFVAAATVRSANLNGSGSSTNGLPETL